MTIVVQSREKLHRAIHDYTHLILNPYRSLVLSVHMLMDKFRMSKISSPGLPRHARSEVEYTIRRYPLPNVESPSRKEGF